VLVAPLPFDLPKWFDYGPPHNSDLRSDYQCEIECEYDFRFQTSNVSSVFLPVEKEARM